MTTSPRTLALAVIALVAVGVGAVFLALGGPDRAGATSAAPEPTAAERQEVAGARVPNDRPHDRAVESTADSDRTGDRSSLQDPHDALVDPRDRVAVSLSGRLVDTSGTGLADVSVHVEGLRSGISSERDGTPGDHVTTDALGVFVLRFEGGIAVTLSYGDADVHLPRVNPVQLIDADVDLGDIELPALGSVEVEVLDDAKRPVPGASVRASLTTSNGGTLATDAFGRATARHLPPGSYRFFATHPSAGRGNAPLDLAAGAREKLKIELRTAP